MTTQNLALIVVVPVVALTAMVIHFNAGRYVLERQCIDGRGNWETREHSSEIGCRFAAIDPATKGTR